ncbi:Clavaminate synthase-like protein [Epithele typhae]|uniref:Clavaminate synthase-like protein n=1 Tax=Epithele typhae TaxID=378194 RepID=UPI00200726FB|nr:Clavaminate synthase-like protein [Epithele typhae]KAH9913573.1 Clavaminate synthase-like protein [Epithele typhae]
MPVAVPVPELGQFNYVAETQENLDWADLITLNFTLYGTPEGNKQLAETLVKGVREHGFFYVKNFNISQERVNRQFSLGKQLYELPLEEKLKYVPVNLDEGGFNGYVPSGRRILDAESGLRDRTEVYNIPKFDGFFTHNHPAVIQDHLAEIEEFAKSLHTEVLDPLHVLLAIALELPEDYFLKIHDYSRKSEDHFRYMKYSKYTPEENAKLGRLWGQGHTDLGSWSLLFRQPVAALQIRHHTTNEWKWVKPQDGTLTVNACDALSFLTGGYVRSTCTGKSVAAPPKDQEHVDRLGILYFSRPNNDVKLETNTFEESGNPYPPWKKWQRSKNRVRGDPEHAHAQILPGYSESRMRERRP